MLTDILARNRDWSAKRQAQEPGYFARLAALQAPEFFWIGCSDSRVPAVVAGLDPGEVLVHRNVANIIHSSDMNMLSALGFAIEALKVGEIVISAITAVEVSRQQLRISLTVLPTTGWSRSGALLAPMRSIWAGNLTLRRSATGWQSSAWSKASAANCSCCPTCWGHRAGHRAAPCGQCDWDFQNARTLRAAPRHSGGLMGRGVRS